MPASQKGICLGAVRQIGIVFLSSFDAAVSSLCRADLMLVETGLPFPPGLTSGSRQKRIPCPRDEIPGVRHRRQRSIGGSREGRRCEGLERTNRGEEGPVLLRVLQLLSKICEGIWPGGKALDKADKEGRSF